MRTRATPTTLPRERSGPEHGGGFLVALQPSGPSRSASVRLRHAVNARGSLDHPNLLCAWPLGEEDGRLLVAVDRSTYPSLTDLLRAGPLEPLVCARVLAGAAAGADALSGRRLLARDVIPDAVFMHPEHGGVLADLGIPPELFVRPSLEQDPALLFRSPEELRGDRLGPRSTVYSLGVLLFTALTRSHPYQGPWSDVHAALAAGAAPPASEGWAGLPPGMDRVIARALAPDPEHRCADPAELARVVAAQLGADIASKTAPVDGRQDEPRATPSSNGAHEPSKANPRSARSAREKRSAQRARAERESPRPRPPRSRQEPPEDDSTKGPDEGPAQPRPSKKDSRVGPSMRDQSRARSRAPRARKAEPGGARAQEGPKRRAAEAAKVSPEQPREKARPRAERDKRDPKARRPGILRAGLSGAAGSLVVALSAVLMLLRAAGLRVLALLQRFGAWLLPALRNAAGMASRVVRRAGSGGAALPARACRRIVAAGRSRAGLVGSLAPALGGVARRAGTQVRRSAAAVTRACATGVGSLARKARGRSPASATSLSWNSIARRRFVLAAGGALVASALTGVALGRVVDTDQGPSSVTRAGLTIQLPTGWEQVHLDPGRPPVLRGIAVGPPEERGSGLVAGKLGSNAAAERMLGDAQAGDGRRTQVRLGELEAWRYSGLQPRPGLVGTGFLIPTAHGAAVVICHALKDAVGFLAECARVASTLVVRGRPVLPLPRVDTSRGRLTQVIATLRSSRAEGLQRLGAADLAPAQVRAANSLERTHLRAARSLDRIPPLANGQSLLELSAALRAASDAYGRLAAAATAGSRSSYREARRRVVREEQALRRELAQVSGA